MDEWVLLKAGAAILAGADTVYAPPKEPVPMEWVRQEDDRVVVRTPAPGHACYPLPFAGPLALELEVAREDLLPVLNAVERQSFPDGSSYRVEPGLAVVDGAVAVGPHRLPVKHVGARYAPVDHVSVEKMDYPDLWAPTTARIGTLLTRTLDPSEPWSLPFQTFRILGNRALLTEDYPCASLVWSAIWPPEPTDGSVGLHGYSGMGGVGGIIGARGTGAVMQVMVPAGTPLHWRDGSPAGHTREELIRILDSMDQEEVCIEMGPIGARLTACAWRKDVKTYTAQMGTGSSPW